MFGPIDVLAAVTAALPVGVVLGWLVWWRRRRTVRPAADAWVDGAIAGWLGAVLIMTLAPLSAFGHLARDPELVLVPFERLPGAPVAYAVANLLLLTPLGFLLVLRGPRPRLLLAIAAGVGASLAIEVLQLFHPDRGTNVDDLLLNALGVLVGAVLGAAGRPLRPSLRRRSDAGAG